MNDLGITLLLVGALFVILASGVWIGLTLSNIAWISMQLFSSRPAGDRPKRVRAPAGTRTMAPASSRLARVWARVSRLAPRRC